MACRYPIFAHLILFGSVSTAIGQNQESAKTAIEAQRKLLGSIKPAMTSEEVIRILGKPDEVRRVADPKSSFHDGYYVGENERWVYGIQKKGTFARVGFVSMGADGRVFLTASPTSSDTLGDWDKSEGIKRADGPHSKLSIQIATDPMVEQAEAPGYIKIRVTLNNSGDAPFELKANGASNIRSLMIFEIFDSAGALLFCENEMMGISPFARIRADIIDSRRQEDLR